MKASLSGRTALLTGASGGLGHAIAARLASEGVDIVLAGRAEGRLERVRRQVEAQGVKAAVLKADLRNLDQVETLARQASEAISEIDILINNAGIERASSYARFDREELLSIIAVDLLAPMLLTRALLPTMLDAGRGSVVNVASLAGRGGLPYGVPYAAAKWGLVGFTQSLRAEYRHDPVGFSVVYPGFVTRAGIHARHRQRGLRGPAAFGTTTPERVAAGVVWAIKRGQPEVWVTGRPIRPLLALATLAPRFSEALSERLGLTEFARSVAKLEVGS